jgi:antitoxin component YwqK of YwqJK toxin-antitoxin module
MKKLLIFIFLLGFLTAEAQIEVFYLFKNQCELSIVQDSISFELQNLITDESFYSENSKVIITNTGKYELVVTINNGKYQRSFEEKIEFKDSKTIIDTLEVPKILIEIDIDSETIYSKYFKCEKICDGYEVDYFENGNKRLEGNFKNGNAIWETEFERDGSSIKYYYDKLNRYTKWEYYDQDGNLKEYLINKYKRKHFIQKTYNAKGKLSKSEVKIYYPIRKNNG